MLIIKKLESINYIYKRFEDLLNSYVCDYYIEDHWKKLPKNWQSCCANMSMDELGELLDLSSPVKLKVYSLSLLSLRSFIVHNIVTRTQVPVVSCLTESNEKFQNLLWKNVKLKKRHEISILAELCYKSALETNCFCVVDIGSGLGHLSRLLTYKYGFEVCAVEANKFLSKSAQELDDSFERALKAFKIKHNRISQPVHLNERIAMDLDQKKLIKTIKNALNKRGTQFKFGLVGLHPCGDLSSTLLHLFVECPEATFINVSSCCYMKLSLPPSTNQGFPLSKYSQNRNFNLSYLSCEIACHAIENYVSKLRSKDYVQFKVHAYRAALEKLLILHNSKLKHSYIIPTKCSHELTFKEYCSKTLIKYDITIPEDSMICYEELLNNTWQNVVIFYSIRLLFAPLIETCILLDRMLFLQENQSICNILPVFDCKISPRNHVICSRKYKDV